MQKTMMKSIFSMAFIFVVQICAAQWEQVDGPYVGTIMSFAANGLLLYAGTDTNGVFVSINNGVRWTGPGSGLKHFRINSLVANGTYVFAATDSSVYRSIDNGSHWARSDSGISSVSVPRPQAKVVILVGNTVIAGTYARGVCISNDNGASWTAMNAGLTVLNVQCLAFGSGFLYAGTRDSGVYRSADTAKTWIAVRSGFPVSMYHVNSLAVNGTWVFAGAGNSLVVSSNGGALWYESPFGSANKSVYAVLSSGLVAAGQKVFAGTSEGLYISTDNAASWHRDSAGLPDSLRVNALSVAGSSFFVGSTHGGVFRSVDNGVTWSVSNQGLLHPYVTCLLMHGNNLYAGTDCGVFLSTNGGSSWVVKNKGLVDKVRGLVDTNILSLCFHGSTLFAGCFFGGVFKSVDSGTTWTRYPPLSPIWALAATDTNVFASVGNGIIHLPNNGGNWSFVKCNSAFSTLNIYSIKVLGSDIFIASNNGVYRTPDEFTTVAAVNAGFYSFKARAFTSIGSELFVGTDNNGIYHTANRGAMWYPVTSVFTDTLPVYSLTSVGSTLYAGLWHGGVYVSTDSGKTRALSGLSSELNPVFASDSNYLYAGTVYGGIWRMPVAGVVGVAGKSVAKNVSAELFSARAWKSGMTIAFHLPREQIVSMDLFDLNGRHMATICNDRFGAGEHRVLWDAKEVGRGFYCVVMRAGMGKEARSVAIGQ